MTFGEKLKKLRIGNKLTQDELADKIFVTRTAISKWETDRGFPNMESLKMLCKVFNISMDTLISDEDLENRKILDDKKAKSCFLGCNGRFFAVCGVYDCQCDKQDSILYAREFRWRYRLRCFGIFFNSKV